MGDRARPSGGARDVETDGHHLTGELSVGDGRMDAAAEGGIGHLGLA